MDARPVRRAAHSDAAFAEHAAPEAVAAELDRARAQLRRQQRRVDWLTDLLAAKTAAQPSSEIGDTP